MILVVGDLDGWERQGRAVPDLDGFRFVRFEELDAALLGAVTPDMVLSALVSDGHDAVDVARRLLELGYRGRYRALAPALPNMDSVVEEVHEAAPGLDFDLFLIGPEVTPP